MLSIYELDLVTNTEIFLTKNRIIQKVYEMFALLSESFTNESKKVLHPELTFISPKISRGENYLGLPYVMMDYPRIFGKEDTFAIRTFFWWGNFFSITLQLSGMHKNRYLPLLNKAIEKNMLKDWYGCINHHEWHHHFRDDNYQQIDNNSMEPSRTFIKIANKISLKEWDQASMFLQKSFKELLFVLHG